MATGSTFSDHDTPAREQMTDTVCVVLVGFRGERWLPDCLSTLRVAARPVCQVIFVDNGNNGDIGRLPLSEFRSITVRTFRPLGFAEANNLALQQISLKQQFIGFLNQDTRSSPGWLDACRACFDKYPDLGAVSPLLRKYDDSGWDPGFRECANASDALVRGLSGKGSFVDFYDVPRVTATAMVVRTDVIGKVGPFDPIYGSYYEDYDLCLRIKRAGYRIGICGTAKVFHHSGSSTTTRDAERKRMQQIIRNRAILRIRAAGRHRLGAIAHHLAGIPRNLLRSILRTPSSQPLSVQLAANSQLLRVLPRIAFQSKDAAEWEKYVGEMQWNGSKDTDNR